MLDTAFLRSQWAEALAYDAYVATGSPGHQSRWRDMETRITLNAPQKSLLAGFVRPVNILVTSGTWCGDCVAQCPMFRAFEKANPAKIALRLVDRDVHAELRDRVLICGGHRVPVFIFLNEDFEFISLMGDRSLTRYRALAAKQLGPSCPVPGAPIPADELAGTIQDWLDELERVHLVCRLSPRLREKHAD